MATFTTSEINRNFLIKIFGMFDGKKINRLVGVSGLIDYVGEERASKFVARAFNSVSDKCVCKVYGGLQVSFYAH